MGGATAGDGEVREEGREEDRHPPHVTSRPTFQTWLRLCVGLSSIEGGFSSKLIIFEYGARVQISEMTVSRQVTAR